MATLMARIEAEEHGDKGRVREWLARAVNARRDPAWTADGVVSERWAPISPVTGALDAFEWRVPFRRSTAASARRSMPDVESLVALERPSTAAASERAPETTEVIEAETVEQGRKSGDADAVPAAGAAAKAGAPSRRLPLPRPGPRLPMRRARRPSRARSTRAALSRRAPTVFAPARGGRGI